MQYYIKNALLVDVVAYATNSKGFFKKLTMVSPDALILDIDLEGDSMSGLDIASKLKLPTLFTSGKIRNYYLNIEDLDFDSDAVVSHVSKPITEEKLQKALHKFISEVNALNKTQFVFLDFLGSKRNRIALDSIVYLGTDKNKGAQSNNKEIYFSNRKPEILIDFSFTKMEEKGLSNSVFIKTHKSFRVNKEMIKCYQSGTREIEVLVCNESGKNEIKRLPVSENYLSNIRQLSK